MEFVVGFDFDKFEAYYRTLSQLNDYYVGQGWREPGPMELRDDERNHIARDPLHLIIWMENEHIVGHTIWHETSTEEMTPGDPRPDDDREILRKLFGGPKENLVELHEIWLRPEHRGKSYGKQFFVFFERFVHERGFDGIVFYATNNAAIAICQKRGYNVEYEESAGLYALTIRFDR